MAVNSTTGLYDLAGGDTSATVTQGINQNFSDLWQQIRDIAHPVGSYYWSSDATSPATLFGGTWVQITGKFILAAGNGYNVGATGGEATHTLTVAEMPSHNHSVNGDSFNPNAASAGTQEGNYPTQVKADYKKNWTSISGLRSGNTGGDNAHNNMPPYEVAYCWRRTA